MRPTKPPSGREKGTAILLTALMIVVKDSSPIKTVQELGVHLVQGFFLHRPQSASSPIVTSVAVDG